ncbi:MAG: hypothetical protein ACXU9U_00955, partial [Parachlamydiaceae bacterium]
KVMTLACVAGVICTGLTSQPGVFIASRLLGLAFSTPQLERVFGPNTIFVINPTHPRHIISIAGAILMAPQALHNFYLFGKNVCQKISAYRNNQIDEPVEFGLLLLPFIELTTRPVLHLGNRLVSLMIA